MCDYIKPTISPGEMKMIEFEYADIGHFVALVEGIPKIVRRKCVLRFHEKNPGVRLANVRRRDVLFSHQRAEFA